tara:strand:+ start:412 stop:1380 length:969 start_codon:yes stop_codon:yes gene_type:complete
MTQNQTSRTLKHTSVMKDQAVDALNIDPAGLYVDATYGRGGYSESIMNRLNQHGALIAFDKDREAYEHAHKKYHNDARFKIFQTSFKSLSQVLREYYHGRKINGIVFDLGISSPQIDDPKRGFSFSKNGPLDMRMNQDEGDSAAEWLKKATEKEIADVLKVYGEEKFSRKIASAIVLSRSSEKSLQTTKDLSDLIRNTVPFYEKTKDPSTRSFQAIRIFINNEIEDIRDICEQLPLILSDHGRVVFVSFQSIEHRVIKQFIKKVTAGNESFDSLSGLIGPIKKPSFKRIGKATQVSNDEVMDNRRSRSAWMRVLEKLSCQDT